MPTPMPKKSSKNKVITSSIRSYSTKTYNSFTPLSVSVTNIPKNFITMDIETMCFNEKKVKSSNGVLLKQREQCPVLITCAYKDNNDKLKTFYTLANRQFLNNRELLLKDLWTRFFSKLRKNIDHKVTVFLHNLGNFDGYFIFLGLLNLDGVKKEDINTIIDSDNQYIQISFQNLNLDLIFKDSLRMFDVSLDNLCMHLKVKGKTEKYNESFNNPNLFNNQILLNNFIKYAVQDSKALYEVLEILQFKYLNKYQIDICDI
jgi:hypothetical protein